jgi:histidinol-phosphate phosphatase family protein
LDRDGVLNKEKPSDYIRSWEEFVFEEGVLEAMRALRPIFGRIIVVTNQRGVGKGLMTERDLEEIHFRMQSWIHAQGGRIDKIYACTDLEPDSPYRKPNPGMAYAAKADFPEIEFHRSVMVGNHLRDMEFGRRLGMYTVWIASTEPDPGPEWADEAYPSLWAWVQDLVGKGASSF